MQRVLKLARHASRSKNAATARFLMGATAAAALCCWLSAPPSVQAFPWSTDMYHGAALQPLEVAPRVMPSGTLPINGMQKMDLEQMTIGLKNPLKATPENLAHGKDLFLNTCMPCHGENADGKGPVAHVLQHKPTNLQTGISKNLPDGYIYGYIRNGGIWMPAYSDAMSSDERWDVIMYVRTIQAKAAEQAKNKVSSR